MISRARIEAPRESRRRAWSVYDDDQLQSLYHTVDLRDIARTLRRTPTAVQQRARVLGLRARRTLVTPGEIEAMGYPLVRIRVAARALGIQAHAWPSCNHKPRTGKRRRGYSPEQVRQMIAWMGTVEHMECVSARGKKLSIEQVAALKAELHSVPWSADYRTRLAAKYGIHPSMVSAIDNGDSWAWVRAAEAP